MHFTCRYLSGKDFGTGSETTNYVASVSSQQDNVQVEFSFRAPPQGKSKPTVTDASIRSLKLSLTRQEALHLAASIIAQAHHPTIHHSSATWIPPESMPELVKRNWTHKVTMTTRYWNNEIFVVNDSKYHLGTTSVSISYEIFENDSSVLHTIQRLKILDLPPGQSKSIAVFEEDIPSYHQRLFDKIVGATIISLTGIVPGQTE